MLQRELADTRRARLSLIGTTGAALLLLTSPNQLGAQGDGKPSKEKGYQISQTLCAGCHLIGERSTSPLPAGVPSFRTIANRLGQTGQKIKDVLIQPHPPMPDIQLTNDEILNIIAYLESLRTNDAVPPLLVPHTTKPKYPTPS